MKKLLAIALTTCLLVMQSNQIVQAAATQGSSCPKLGLTSQVQGKKLTCVKIGMKLIWNSVQASKKIPVPSKKSADSKTYSEYEKTKLKAYRNIRSEADLGNLDKVSLVYHVSDLFPNDLLTLYKSQVEYASKLYGSFFNKRETINIYLYTEKDEKYLDSEKLFSQDLPDHIRWFNAWRNGQDQQHNLGLAAWYMEYPSPGIWEGHAGLLVYSGANTSSLRKYAIQVMPHEYWHVVQDYYFRTKWDNYVMTSPKSSMNPEDFYAMLFPTTFREGSANTISFAMASNSEKEYLDLYRDFIQEKKNQTEIKLFSTLTSTTAVELALKKIENRRLFSEAHESSYSLGSLLYEWVIAQYGFDAFRKLIQNQLVGNSFEDNVKASLGISVDQMYKGAAPHILAAFSQK